MDFAFEIVDISEVEETDSSFSLTNSEIKYEDVEVNVVLLHCNYCGSCSDPDTCVFSVVCPRCGSETSQLCREKRGSTKLVGLHAERWREAKGKEYAWRD